MIEEYRETGKTGMIYMKRAGLLIRAVMLMALCIAMLSGCSIYDKITNRWDFDRREVAGAIAEKDAGDLYEFISPYMLEENDLTEDDLREFLDRCGIENVSSKDMDRYTSYEFLGEPLDLRETITGRTGINLLTRCTMLTMTVPVSLSAAFSPIPKTKIKSDLLHRVSGERS